MGNIFILEPIHDEAYADNRIFYWANVLNSRGYKVEQIWESCDNTSKGISLSEGVDIVYDYETESIYIECNTEYITDESYIALISDLTSIK